MKKKLVSILVATMVCASVMTGCGSVSDHMPEDVKTEARLTDEFREALEDYGTDDAVKEVPETDKDEVFNPETVGILKDKNVTEESDQTFEDIAEEEQLDIDIVQKIAEQLDPVAIAAEESWTEALDMGREWKDLVCELNQRIAEKAVVKLVDIDLAESTATYRVTAPDVAGFLAENVKRASSAKELAEVINEVLERDDIPVKEKEITVPIEVSGSDVRICLDDSEIIDSITGGFYRTFKTV